MFFPINPPPLLTQVPSKNLFNPATAIQGSYIAYNSGSVLTSATYYASAFIPVTPNTEYTMSGNKQMAFYDRNQIYISGINSLSTINDYPSQFTTPLNCEYVRISVLNTTYPIFQLELGGSPTAYQAYGAVTSSFMVPESVSASMAAFLQPVPSLNLFNINAKDVALGFFVNHGNGALTANAGSNATGFIPCQPNTQYTINYKGQGAYYDANQLYISGDSTGGGTVDTIVTPPTAAFMRWSVNTGVQWTYYMLNKGSTSLPWQPFLAYMPIGQNQEQIQPFKTSAANMPQMSIPLTTYMLKSYENTLYFTGMNNKFRYREFYMYCTGTSGMSSIYNYSNLARIDSPTSGGVLTFTLYDDNFNILQTLSTTVNIGDPAVSSPAVVLNAIGDSYTNNGSYLLQANTYCPNITFVGMRDCYGTAPTTITAEGRSGWTLNQYFTQFHSTTDTYTPLMHPPSPYTYYGNTNFWQQAMLNPGGSGFYAGYYNIGVALNMSVSTGYRATPNVNDLMYNDSLGYLVQWNGSAWVQSSVTFSQFTFNYAKYLSVYGITTPTHVLILLGSNDFRLLASTALIQAAFPLYQTQMKTAIASILAAVPSAIIAIGVELLYSGAQETDEDTFIDMQTFMMAYARQLIITAFDNQEANSIYLVDMGVSTDPDFSFNVFYEQPFYEYTAGQCREVQDNNPHMLTGGFLQYGTPLAAFIQYTR